MCRKRNVSAIASCGRISSLRTSAASTAPGGRRRSADSSPSASHSKSWPITDARSSRSRSSSGKASSRAAIRACTVGGTSGGRLLRRASPAAARRRAGSPRPTSRIRARVASSTTARPRSSSISSSDSSPESGWSVSRLPRPRGPCVVGLGARRAEQERRRVPRPVGQVLTRSSSVGSAQCTSSMTSASGRAPSALLERLAHCPEDLLRPPGGERRLELVLGPGFAEDLDERPVGDPLAVREAAAGEDGRLGGRDRLRPRARAATCRCPGGPRTVTMRQRRSLTASSKAERTRRVRARRPTSGASSRRSNAGAPSMTRTSRWATSGSASP